jgi:cellulose 1,4-beta-cellobiosidase
VTLFTNTLDAGQGASSTPFGDELDYATALRDAFVARGFPSGIGMLIDTSRNGWGGPNRPTAAPAAGIDAYVW